MPTIHSEKLNMTETDDTKHLDLLSTFHYVVGGLVGLMACFPIIHLIIGISIVTGSLVERANMQSVPPDFPSAMFGWLFIILSSLFILFGLTMAVLIVIAGKKLKQRRAYTYCLVIAGIECLFMPFGTVLGIFTIVVLMRNSVKVLFTMQKDTYPPTYPAP